MNHSHGQDARVTGKQMSVAPYMAVMSARFRALLQYRAAAVAGVATQLFFGFVRVQIFDAFYQSSRAPQPMTHDQVITYIWLGQALLLLVMFYVDPEIAAMIRSGAVASELVRPVDLYGFWFARCFVARAAPTLMRCVPIFLIAGLFLRLRAPASAGAGTLFVVSTLLGLVLASAMVTLITTTLLWTISGEGVSRLAPPLIFMLSGLVIPLPMFPDWMQGMIRALPFRALVDTPFRIYVGHLIGAELVVSLVHQVFWTAAFIMLGRWVLARVMHRVVIQGG
jgi:ABC-2 type transport system permease protein